MIRWRLSTLSAKSIYSTGDMTAASILCLGLLVMCVATPTFSQDYEDDDAAIEDDAAMDDDAAAGEDDAYQDNPEGPEGHQCECVPFYLCNADNIIITDGAGVFDVRARANGVPMYDVPNEECPKDDDDNPMVCCGIPTTGPLTGPPPTTRLCGTKGGSMVNLPGMVRIQGGSDLSFGELPWMLVLTKVTDVEGVFAFKCGASLIHPQVALTGAHCVAKDLDEKHYMVRAGEYDTSGEVEALPHQDREVTEIAKPQNFNEAALYHDFALLHLDKPMTLSDHIALICLPERNDLFNMQGCMASGWGRDAIGGNPNTVLRKVDLAMVPAAACQKTLRKSRLGRYFILDPSFVCAQGMNGADTCEGDGGSPLVCPLPSDPSRWVQVGITAWGIGCGSDLPAVYANVARGRAWIDQQLHLWGYDVNDQPQVIDDLDNTIQDVFSNNNIQ